MRIRGRRDATFSAELTRKLRRVLITVRCVNAFRSLRQRLLTPIKTMRSRAPSPDVTAHAEDEAKKSHASTVDSTFAFPRRLLDTTCTSQSGCVKTVLTMHFRICFCFGRFSLHVNGHTSHSALTACRFAFPSLLDNFVSALFLSPFHGLFRLEFGNCTGFRITNSYLTFIHMFC